MTRTRIGLVWLTLTILIPVGWRIVVDWHYRDDIYPLSAVPEARVGIVFGAAVYRNGRLSSVLRDRMEVAIRLYESGKIDKILVSGDNRFVDYNEPAAMRHYAIQRGVESDDIQPDYGGRRTYDTCYRAKHIFQVERAIVITQGFHLPRALFICRQLGIQAVGVAADLRLYRGNFWFNLREIAATFVALWDVIWRKPPPIMGDPIPL